MWILERLKEPSSHAGISALLAAVTSFFPQYAAIIWTVAGIFGFGAVVISEKSA